MPFAEGGGKGKSFRYQTAGLSLRLRSLLRPEGSGYGGQAGRRGRQTRMSVLPGVRILPFDCARGEIGTFGEMRILPLDYARGEIRHPEGCGFHGFCVFRGLCGSEVGGKRGF